MKNKDNENQLLDNSENNLYTYCQLLCTIFKSKVYTYNKIYLISVFTYSVLLFVSTAIQFWMTDYFIKVLHI